MYLRALISELARARPPAVLLGGRPQLLRRIVCTSGIRGGRTPIQEQFLTSSRTCWLHAVHPRPPVVYLMTSNKSLIPLESLSDMGIHGWPYWNGLENIRLR